jgi:uncharacterized protein with ParB-like and HNH nuclease domain
MSAVQTIKDFNLLFTNVLQQMSPMIGNSYYMLFNNLCKFNASLAIENFYYYSLPHSKQIMSKNEKFFLDEDNLEDLTKGEHKQNGELLNMIQELKHVWTKLDKDSKENLWMMIQALHQLSISYGQMKGL